MRRFLRLACPPSLSMPELSERLAHSETTTARERVRAAQTALKEADQVLARRAEETNRVRELLATADEAEQQQQAAEEALRSASTSWGKSGAAGETPENVKVLAAAATAARDKAHTARIVAEGLQDALESQTWDAGRSESLLLSTHAEALAVRTQAQNELNAAVNDVILAEVQPILERAHRARAALAAEVPAILGLAELARMRRNTFSFADVDVIRELQQLAGPLPEQRTFQTFLNGASGPTDMMSVWDNFGRALLTNADAALALNGTQSEPA